MAFDPKHTARSLIGRRGQRGFAGLTVLMLVLVVVAIMAVFLWLRHEHRVAQATPASGSSTTQSPAPTGSAALPPGSHAYSIESGGVQRSYRVYVPQGISGRVPLVVMLHGGGGSGQVAEHYYGWDGQADQSKFIVVYPDGLGSQVPAWNVDGSNQDGSPCCGYPARQHISDVQFIKAVVAKIESQAAIDTNRVYATGISNGGIMSYTLACETDLFAAIGPDSATMLNACGNPTPTSVIHVHGLADTIIRFDGGPGSGTAGIDGPSVPDVIAAWRRTDNCTSPGQTTAGEVTTSIAGCADNRAVELITIANAGHGWPGSPAKSANSTSGGAPPSQAINATAVIWAFFAAHPKP